MSYAGKSEIDEALRPDGVYGHDGVLSGDVVARPAETKRTPEEDKAQSAYADQVEAEANAIGDPEMFRARLSFAGRVRDAIPIAEFLSRRRALNRARDDVPGGLPLLEQAQIRDGYDREIDALEGQNIYNPTLFQIMAAFDRDGRVDPFLFLGPNPDSADVVTRSGVEAAHVVLGLGAEKSQSKPKPKAKPVRTYKPGLVSRKDGWCQFCGVEVTVGESRRAPHKGGDCEPGDTPLEKAFLRTFR